MFYYVFSPKLQKHITYTSFFFLSGQIWPKIRRASGNLAFYFFFNIYFSQGIVKIVTWWSNMFKRMPLI